MSAKQVAQPKKLENVEYIEPLESFLFKWMKKRPANVPNPEKKSHFARWNPVRKS